MKGNILFKPGQHTYMMTIRLVAINLVWTIARISAKRFFFGISGVQNNCTGDQLTFIDRSSKKRKSVCPLHCAPVDVIFPSLLYKVLHLIS